MYNYRELFFDKQDQLLIVTQKAIKLLEEREKLEALLDTALEHFSHGWLALEKQGMVTYKDPDVFPPFVSDEVGSASYHFAAVADNVKRAYDIIAAEHSVNPTKGGQS
jgi:hypothetical protein